MVKQKSMCVFSTCSTNWYKREGSKLDLKEREITAFWAGVTEEYTKVIAEHRCRIHRKLCTVTSGWALKSIYWVQVSPRKCCWKKKENQVLRGMRRLEGLTLKTAAHGLRTINVEMLCSVVCEMLKSDWMLWRMIGAQRLSFRTNENKDGGAWTKWY